MTLATDQAATAGLLLERGGQLGVLHDGARRALGGDGSVVVLEGGCGLGKTALMRAAESGLPGPDACVLAATGREHERDLTFGGVLQLFEETVAGAPAEERDRLLSGPAVLAAPLLVPGPQGPAAGDQASLLRGLYRLSENLAAVRPLVLLVDDADSCDPATLRFLLYLSERMEELPLMLVLACGSALPGPGPGVLDHLLAHPLTVRTRLEPLSPEATAELLRRLTGQDVPESSCREAHAVTAGNPLLVEQLAAALPANGAEPRVGTPDEVGALAPEATARWLLRRAAGLGPDAVSLLQAISVLGPGGQLRQAAELARVERPRAADLVDALCAAGILVPGERIAFTQPIVRTAVEAELPLGRRAELHLQAAQLLSDDDAPPDVVAAQLLGASKSGSEGAVDALSTAADQARERGEPGLAVRYLRRALEEPPVRERRAELVLELGRAEATAGEPQAVARLTEAIELATDPGERARAALCTGRTLVARGRLADARTSLERGLRDAGEEESELRSRLQTAHATVARLAAPGTWTDLAPAGPPVAADTPAKRALLAHAALEAALRGAPREEAVELAARALHRGALLDDETADGITYYLAACALVLGEDLSTAEAALTAAVEEARTRGSVLGLATASHFRSLAIMRRGRLTDAVVDAKSALNAERYGWRLALPSVHSVLADALIESGDADGAREHLEAGERIAAQEASPGKVALLASRGRFALLNGEPEQALQDFLRCGERLVGAGVLNPAVMPWRAEAASAHALMGRTDEAIALAGEELALAEAAGAPGAIGAALRNLGALHEGEEGLALLEQAVERLDHSQAALERARALVDYGGALRRGRKRRLAREPLHRGLDLALRCGAKRLVDRARSELAAAGARPRRTAMEGVEALTAREREVAALAAEGLTNREIARSLYVTVKTVEWHLKHAYKKLGVSSRTELRGAMGP